MTRCLTRCAGRGLSGAMSRSLRATLKARAFDVARYLLSSWPQHFARQITNARTLKPRSRGCFLIRRRDQDLGVKLRKPPPAPLGWSTPSRRYFVEMVGPPIRSWSQKPPACSHARLRSAPTLVNTPSQRLPIQTRAELAQAAEELLESLPHAGSPVVDLVEPTELSKWIGRDGCFTRQSHS